MIQIGTKSGTWLIRAGDEMREENEQEFQRDYFAATSWGLTLASMRLKASIARFFVSEST